ncbi:MAG: response regulator transcription factor [Lachnospiraceae bacterium]|nr:response regulator transcription factor [Lachnospiraceae bacterium]
MAYKVLVVDDEKIIVKGIKFNLEQEGMEVDTAYDGKQAVEYAFSRNYDIILLDIMLPEYDGYQVCQMIRERSDVPIIMLTAKGDDMDKIIGLETGADDYVTKPFNIVELKARIKAIIRRTQNRSKAQPQQQTITAGDMTVETDSRRVFIKGAEVNLTAKEFDLLKLLILNPNKVYNRSDLLKFVWGADYPGDERTVDVHVRRLREKIEEDPSKPEYIQTKWGVGYYFQAV